MAQSHITNGPLTGETLLVSGGAQGIGAAVARCAAAQGAQVAIVDLRPADDVVEVIASDGGRARGFLCDVTDGAALDAMADECRRHLGAPTIVVSNAGRNSAGDPVTMTEREWDDFFALDLKATWLLTQRFLADMIAQRHGSIVIVASLHARLTSPGYFPYAAAKSGLIGLTRSLALEVAPHQVRVNAVSPGWVRTPLVDAWLAEHPDDEPGVIASQPLGRIATAEEIADVICFLASTRASFVTGAEWAVDGGLGARFA